MTKEIQTGRNPFANIVDIADIANITYIANIGNLIANIADIANHYRRIYKCLCYTTKVIQTGRNPIANIADIADIENPIANITDIEEITNVYFKFIKKTHLDMKNSQELLVFKHL